MKIWIKAIYRTIFGFGCICLYMMICVYAETKERITELVKEFPKTIREFKSFGED